MEYVYLLQATEAQYQKIMKFLDTAIKKDGLDVIQDVVDVYNVLVSGRKTPLYQEAAQRSPLPEELEEPKTEEESAAALPG